VLSTRQSPFPALLRAKTGGAEGSRTPDLLIANETLYQLSYDPSQTWLKLSHSQTSRATPIYVEWSAFSRRAFSVGPKFNFTAAALPAGDIFSQDFRSALTTFSSVLLLASSAS
jgi:hypothetical protein